VFLENADALRDRLPAFSGCSGEFSFRPHSSLENLAIPSTPGLLLTEEMR
jgi:hypothetical protein